jgi:TetR/AcrR family transcriptional repressor of nem operon
MIQEHEEKGLNGCLIGNLAAEIGNTSSICQHEMQKAFNSWRKRFIPLIKMAQNNGQIRNDISAELLSDVFWSTWEGGLLNVKINPDIDYLEKILDTVLDTLFKP